MTKSTDYKRGFGEKNYDRLAITVPKGRKADIEKYTVTTGETVNGIVNRLLREQLGMSEQDWKKIEPGD